MTCHGPAAELCQYVSQTDGISRHKHLRRFGVTGIDLGDLAVFTLGRRYGLSMPVRLVRHCSRPDRLARVSLI